MSEMTPVAIRFIGHMFVVALVQVVTLLAGASLLSPLPISNTLVAFLLAGYVTTMFVHIYAIYKSRWHAEERFPIGAAVLAAWTAPLAFVFFDAAGRDLGWILRFLGFILAVLSLGGAIIALVLGKNEFGGWLPTLLSLPWGVASFVALNLLGHTRAGETVIGIWFLWIGFIGIPPLWKRTVSKALSKTG